MKMNIIPCHYKTLRARLAFKHGILVFVRKTIPYLTVDFLHRNYGYKFAVTQVPHVAGSTSPLYPDQETEI